METQHYRNVRQIPGGGGGGVMGNLEINGDKQLPSSDETAHNLYTNIEQDNESVLVSLLSVIGMPYSECP